MVENVFIFYSGFKHINKYNIQFYIKKEEQMDGSLLRFEQTQYNGQASAWCNKIQQKPTYAVSTVNISKQKQQESLNSLSKIILNFEDFWIKKAHQNQNKKQNSIEGCNLYLDSMLSSNNQTIKSFNELSLKSKSIRNSDINQISYQLKNKQHSKQPLSERQRKIWNTKLTKALQIQSKKSLNDVSSLGQNSLQYQSQKNLNNESYKSCDLLNQPPKNQKNISLQTVKEHQSDMSKFETSSSEKKQNKIDLVDLDSLHNLIGILQLLEEVALVGYWCSKYLGNSRIRWEKVCTYLYIQCYIKLCHLKNKQNGHAQIRDFEWKRKQYENILENIHGMLQKSSLWNQSSEIHSAIHAQRSIYQQIIKLSKNFIKDVVKDETMNKNYQFCMFKMIKALIIIGRMNGLEINIGIKLEQTQEFSTKSLKNNLLIYKQILKNSSLVECSPQNNVAI